MEEKEEDYEVEDEKEREGGRGGKAGGTKQEGRSTDYAYDKQKEKMMRR